jgi:hypothetical protein
LDAFQELITMKRLHALVAAICLVALAGLAAPLLTSAHEQRDVDNGKYHFVVGWLNEPAYTGLLNSIDLTVTQPNPNATPAATAAASDDDHPAGTPVTGLEDTLKVDIIYNDKTMNLPLSPAWNNPGHYVSYVIPTQAGDYSFHIYGTINGDKVDETFTSGPNTFGTVIDAKTIEFPQP